MPSSFLKTAALAAVAALTLAACGGSSGGEEQAGATAGAEADIAAIADVVWTTDDAGLPALEFDAPIAITGAAARVVTTGDGDTISEGHNMTVDYIVVNGLDGEVLYSTYDRGGAETLSVKESFLDPVLFELLVGRGVGTELIYGVPGSPQVDGTTETMVMAITVQSTAAVLERADGTPQAPLDGLPVITLAEDGSPSIEFPAGDPPAGLVAQLLIEGQGAEVATGTTITAHYTGWLWNGEQFDSSWPRGEPLSIRLAPGSVIDGWTQGLTGHPIGSQVLLIIPPELGYGESDSGSIPGGSTLVFVVDILAAS